MTDSDYTHLTILVDSSGSMQKIKSDTEGAINTFIEEQKKGPGRVTLTLTTFDTTVKIVHEHIDIAESPEFVLHPTGMTALYDAMGITMAATGAWLASLPEEQRPGKVIFVVMTDGHENSSKEYTAEQIADLTQLQARDYAWEFTYLGANQDAILVAKQMGIDPQFALTYAGQAVGQAVGAASASVSRSRMGGNRAYTEAERTAAMG